MEIKTFKLSFGKKFSLLLWGELFVCDVLCINIAIYFLYLKTRKEADFAILKMVLRTICSLKLLYSF